MEWPGLAVSEDFGADTAPLNEEQFWFQKSEGKIGADRGSLVQGAQNRLLVGLTLPALSQLLAHVFFLSKIVEK